MDMMTESTINKILMLILSVICVGIVFAEIQYKRFDRFSWRIAAKAGENQVVQLYGRSGGFYPAIDHIMSDDMRSNSAENNFEDVFLPDSFFMKWFSYNENKFYEASFALPTDSLKFLVHNLKKQADNRLKNIELSNELQQSWRRLPFTFLAELKENGLIVLWLSIGLCENTIISAQAKEVEYDWKTFKPDSKLTREEYIDLICSQYPWNLVASMPENLFPSEINISTYADRGYYFEEENNTLSRKDKPFLKIIPYSVRVRNENLSSWQTWADIYFDEREIYDAFSTLYKSKKEEVSTIHIRVNDILNDSIDADVWIEKGNIKIKMDSVRVY
jgi:hypothetical protein